MFLNFFNELREAKVPVTLKEYLLLMEAMDKQVIDMDVEDFYYLSRAALVKDERNIDKFDKVFGQWTSKTFPRNGCARCPRNS